MRCLAVSCAAALLMLAPTACGGDAFQAGELSPLDLDASPYDSAATDQRSSLMPSTATDASSLDGPSGVDSQTDQASAPTVDASSTRCVSYPLAAPAGSTCEGTIDAGVWKRDVNCWGVPLPPQCMCDFNCQCLSRYGANVGCMQGAGCFDTDAGPLLVCQ